MEAEKGAVLGVIAVVKRWANVALVVGTMLLMAIGGFAAFGWGITVLLGLGWKYHGVFDYYANTYPLPAGVFMLGSISGGVAAPGVVVWQLRKNGWRIGLRAFFLATTVAAVLAAVYAFATTK